MWMRVAGLGVGLAAMSAAPQVTVLRDVTVIDGEGGVPRRHASAVIEGGEDQGDYGCGVEIACRGDGRRDGGEDDDAGVDQCAMGISGC